VAPEPTYRCERIADAGVRGVGVFMEIPGTRLSLEEASRLSGLEPTTCRGVLEALQDARFLKRGRDGLFARLSEH